MLSTWHSTLDWTSNNWQLLGMLALLIYLAKEDFEQRAIPLWGLVLFSIFSVAYASHFLPWTVLKSIIAWNLAFVVLQLAGLSLYFSLKEWALVSIADRYLGWGDILFLLPLCFLFSPCWFLCFYFSSLIITLVGFLVFNFFKNGIVQSIPLAGGQALCLTVWLVLGLFSNIDFYALDFFYK